MELQNQSIRQSPDLYETLMVTQPSSQQLHYKLKFDDNNKNSKDIERDYNKIHELIKGLENKIGDIVKTQEDDFMIAFKEQMHDIQKELKAMKRKIDEEALRQKADEKKRILEEERDYFREEALRLDKLCQEQLRTIEELKFKLKIIQEEKNYYEGFVIDSKKENKALKYELLQLYKQKMDDQKAQQQQQQQQQQQNRVQSLSIQQRTSNKRRVEQRPFTQEGNQCEPLQDKPGTSSNKTQSYNRDIYSTQQDFFKRELSSQQQSRFNQDMHQIDEEQKNLQYNELKNQLSKEKSINQQLRAEQSMYNCQRSELEQILLDCVNSMKKEIQARQASQRLLLSGKSIEIDKEHEVNYSQFTSADKKQLLKRFLMSEDFLDKLYQYTFNPPGSGSGQLRLNEKWKRDAKDAEKKFNQFKTFKFHNVASQPLLGGMQKKDMQSTYNNFTDKTRGLIQKVKNM